MQVFEFECEYLSLSLSICQFKCEYMSVVFCIDLQARRRVKQGAYVMEWLENWPGRQYLGV